jgi:hypothetical protein
MSNPADNEQQIETSSKIIDDDEVVAAIEGVLGPGFTIIACTSSMLFGALPRPFLFLILWARRGRPMTGA